MRRFLLFVFAVLYFQCWGQGNMITINSTVPTQMTICGPAKTFTITIYNPSPFTLTNDTLKLTMPPGIVYQVGSITGPGVTQFNISTLNQPVFLLPNIPTLSYLNISFTAAATCDVMAFLSGGGIVENTVRINYKANGNNTFDQHTTSSYIVRQPNISISNFTNQSYSGAIGDVFTRCVTVTNGGFGELSQFTLTDIHGSGLQITNVSQGTWVNSGNTETITLSGPHFATIGDGDNLFENGESIVICETVNVLNCISVASAFEAYWGCNGQNCQSSTSNANVVFPNLIPNLVLTPIPSMNSCMGPGNASLQQLKIVNNGLGKATNIQLDIFQTGGGGSGYQPNLGSNIDPASFTVQTGLVGSASTITPVSTFATNALNCMTSPKGRVLITIPLINPGDTVYLKWNSYTCCYNACTNVGDFDINGWRFKGTYENICQTTYIIPETWGRVYSRLRVGVNNNGSPSTLSDGQTGTFNFLFSTYENNGAYPVGPGAYWKIEITVPPCLVYNPGTFLVTRSNGINTWTPTSVTASGNTITAIFNGSPPWSLLQAQITFDATVNCSACGGSNSGSVGIKVSYVSNNTCPCEVFPTCQSTAISVICPGPCPEGMLFKGYEMKRTSYGLPDNEVGGGNGVPDPGGVLDFTKIKTDRAMFGDTIRCSFNGVVKTSINYPSWQYCYANSSISNGNRLTFIDATLYIYRAGGVLLTCNSIIPTVTNSGSTRNFIYDLSVASNACLTGYIYSSNDSIVFKPRYKVTSNIGNTTPINCYSSNEYYLSDIANPTLAANKFQCSNYNGNTTIIGYYFSNHGPDNLTVKSCNNVTISQNYYLSIGPCCNNYAGGNLFPYEYRNWAHIKVLKAIVPPGYDYISAQFNQVRTGGTIVSVTNPTPPAWQVLNPVNPNSDTLEFLVEQYFQGYGGTIPLSDDGFHGTLQVVLRPSCEVTPSVTLPIKHVWTFAPTTYLTGSGSASTTLTVVNDSITYDAPFLFLQSTLPAINAPDMLASWEISISNLSNVSNALNTWLSGPVMSGINITEVYDLDNSVVLLPVGEIYQVGTINAGETRNFRITAGFTSCLKDSVIIYSGWNCNGGYPATVASYPCTPKAIQLTLTPLMPALVCNVTAPPSTIQLCDTASYTIEGVNVQLGTAYEVTLTAVLPPGVTIISGSSQYSYPITNPYIGIQDPDWAGGTTYKWNISLIDTTGIGPDGLKGIIQNTLNKFKLTFKVVTSCGYTSGSTIAFNLQGEAACGMPTGQEVALSSQLGITGATPPYLTTIRLVTTYISPCANTSVMHVFVRNGGSQAFSTTDSIYLELPPGVTYVGGSFVGLHNQPLTGTPVQYMLNGSQYLVWKLPAGVVVGDSTVFDFSYQGDAVALSCAINEFEARTTSSTNVLCTQSGASCGINIATGDTTLSVFTYKAYLSLSNGNATSVHNPPSGETVSVSFDITNTGEAISNGANSILQFYYDSNGNGSYDAGDVFIIQDTIQVTNNSVLNYTNTFNAPAGTACSILATVRNAVNPCVCNPSELLLTPPVTILGNDTTVCSGFPVTLGPAAVTGYIYSWSPTAGLSSAAVSNPVLTTSNPGTSPVTTEYIVTVNRMGCTAKDTIAVTVNPLPVSNAGPDITICPTNTPGNLGASSTAGYGYSWSPASGLSNTGISNPTVNLSTPDTTLYVVTTTSLGCVTKDSVLVRINPLPTATISGSTSVCKDAASPDITFTGSGATAPYTFTYSINNGAAQTVTTTSGNSVTVSVPTTTVDTLVYTLISVQESSPTSCLQLQPDMATVIINPLPLATLSGSTAVCQGSASPELLFVGSGATAPYTFSYQINGGSVQTISTSGSDSITLAVPTTIAGTFTYTLISVQDSSITLCQQNQQDTVTVIVNPSPTATISNSVMTVCKDAASPTVTFTGGTGTPPYTFTYHLNGGALQTVTTTGGNSIDITVPTTTADTLVYTLLSVEDSSSTICTQAQSGTATVIVNPLPTATISGTTVVCKDDPSPQITFTGASSTAPYTFTYTINNGTPQTITTTNGNSVSVAVPTTASDTLVYRLLSVQDASSTSCSQLRPDTATVIINPLPTATIAGTTTVCQDAASPLVTFTGAAGTPPYTFTYNVNSGPNLTVTTVFGDTVSVPVPTSTAGALTYVLMSVQDSSPSVCSQAQNSTATVTIKPLPTAIISGTTSVCKDGNPPTITFTAAGGTSPYLFTYSIDSVVQPVLISTGSVATVTVPTGTAGTFVYNLISVQESSAYQCSQAQPGSAVVMVNPLPTATVTGTTEVCRKGASPGITFTGANGTSPYTFTYTINNGPSLTVGTSIGSNSTVVMVPTANADTLVYRLISVQDGSSTACSQLQADSATVIINPLPTANFSPTEVCFNTPVQFTDLSVVSNDSITAWAWSFGQEGTSILQNPVFTYIGFGNFIASLIVTTSNGCIDTASGLVVVHPLPSPSFFAGSVCDGATTTFNDLSSIVAPDSLDSWIWEFGDNTYGSIQEPTHLYGAAGNYTVQLTVLSTFGCTDSITEIVKVHPNPEIAFTASDTVGCEPLCVFFQDVSQIQSGIISNWLWDTGDGSPMSTASEFEHCYENDQLTPTDYSVTLTAVSDSGCTSVLNKTNFITVYPKPEADFIARPLTTTILDPVITVSDSSVGASIWSWDFGDGSTAAIYNPPAHVYGDTGHFTIIQIVTNIYGCKDTATELVIVEPDFAFYVPNAFTPNDDGINDSFIGKGVFIIEFEMWIYDRWGNMVYYSDHLDKPWDGRANGGKDMAQMDVYVYVIKLKDIFSNPHKYKGTVTLVR